MLHVPSVFSAVSTQLCVCLTRFSWEPTPDTGSSRSQPVQHAIPIVPNLFQELSLHTVLRYIAVSILLASSHIPAWPPLKTLSLNTAVR